MSDYRQRRKVYKDISGSTVLAVGDNLSVTPRTLVAARTGYTTFIQKIVVHVITDNAATQQFQDSVPLIIAKTKASPGIGPIPFDFGEEGRALGQGLAFQLANSGAGLVADITWEGYQKPTATLTPSQV